MEKAKKLIALLPLAIFLFSIYASATTNDPALNNPRSSHFVLVHEACFGAWVWYKIVSPLKLAGHNVTAIDLAASGINLTPVSEVRSLSDYAKPLIDFMGSLPPNERVILVGHSLGGASVSLAMEVFPEKIKLAVFLTAFMPGPTLSYSSLFQQAASQLLTALDNKVEYGDGPNNPPTTFIFGPKYLSQVLYQRSPRENVELALSLERPLSLLAGGDIVLTDAKYGSVKRVFIVCEQDQVLSAEFQRFMISRNPPNKVVTIRGSDHSVMTSQPGQLMVELLATAASGAA